MAVQIGAVRRALTSGARRIVGRCALAAIGAGLGAISISTFGDDLATGSLRSITGPSQAHSRMVDQLYEELMRWTSPCARASTDASMAGGC